MAVHPHRFRSQIAVRSLFAGLAASAFVLAGCSASPTPTSTATSGSAETAAPITLKLSTFGDSAAMKKLAEQYHAAHPNITVEVNTVASSEDARTNLLTKLAAGNGLADIEQLETYWVGQLKQYSNQFVALEPDQYGGFVSIQSDPVQLADGKVWAYGAGTGPIALCYRASMLEDAGMPSDPAELTPLLGGTWDEYFAAGEKYAAAGGQGKWYDSSYLIWNAQIEQLPYPYEDADDKVVVNNPQVEAIFKNTLAHADKLSAKLSPWSEDWNSGMGTGKFATITCPSWQLAGIEGSSKGVTDWRIANALPGGGGNLGGSFLTIPAQSQHPAEAADLLSWLTSPDGQIQMFKEGMAFPSRLEALNSPALREITNPFFGDAKVGEIFADRAAAISAYIYKGPAYVAIDTAAFNAITRVENGQQSIDDAWLQFVSESEAAQQ